MSEIQSQKKMPTLARLYQGVVITLGLVLAAMQALQWTNDQLPEFAIYLLLSIAAALLGVSVPTVAGQLSVGFVFVLAGIAQLGLAKTLIIGVVGAVLQIIRLRGWTRDWNGVCFQIALTALGIEAAHAVYEGIMRQAGTVGAVAALPIAAAALFLVNAFPLAAITALAEETGLRRVWSVQYLWALPYYLAGAAIAGMLSGLFHAPSLLLIIPIVYLVYRSFALQVERIQKEKQHSEELKSLQIGVIEALALAVEAKDTGSNEHLRRMLIYAEGVGREMGLKDDELKALQAAALLHDIGKLAVPDYILSKPGRLTPEEFDRLKVHPLVGAEIIERARFPYAVAPIVRAHHERWDGSGYPFGLHGEEIPVGARILAAVDTLDALASDRHYRRAMSMDRALVAVSCEAGKAFDPAVVAVLRRIHRDLEDKARDIRMDPSPLAHSLEKANQGAFPAGLDGSAAHSSGSFLASITAARKEEQTLHDLLQTIGHSLDLKETIGQLQSKLEGLIPNDTAVLYAVRGDGLQAVHVAGQNFKAFEDLRVRLGMGLSGGVAVTRKPTVNGRPGDDLIYSADPEAGSRLKSGLALPLETGQELIGILTLYSDKPSAYTSEHLRPLLALAPKLAVWLENALKFHQAESMATNDYLTGLPNAGSLYLHLQNEICRCERQNSDLVLMLCDLDGFKKVNDTFGHLVGNKVLQLVAKGLKESCREYDFVARMGGDEFVVVLPGLPEDAIRSREDRFRQMVEEAGIEACGEEMLGLSVGEARFGPDGRTADELIHCADERMYENKVARKELKRHRTAHEWSPKDFLKNLSR